MNLMRRLKIWYQLFRSQEYSWGGGAKWQGNSVIRISVSSYKTTYDDIAMSVDDFVHQRNQV